MNGRWLRRCGLLIALAASAPAGAVSDGVVRVLMLTDMGGAFSDILGQGAEVAAELAVTDVGETVAGAPVDVVVRDSGSDPAQALAALEEAHGETPLDLVIGPMTLQVGKRLQPFAEREDIVLVHAGTSSDAFTNEACSPVGVHWIFDTHAAGAGIRAIVDDGARRWHFLTADHDYGHGLADQVMAQVRAAGGIVTGEQVVSPTAASLVGAYDTALSHRPEVIALALGTEQMVQAIRESYEPRVIAAGEHGETSLVVAAFYLSTLQRLDIYVTQGLEFVTSFYWNRTEASRAWTERFQRAHGRRPTAPQAAVYSALRHYLEAVATVGDDPAGDVLAAMREAPVDDGVYASEGRLRADGQMVHDLYRVRVKAPAAVTRAGDYLEVVETLPGDEAFQPLAASRCPRL